MDIYSQNIYEVIENNIRKHILIIYNISENHYVGLTVNTAESDNLTYIESINRFIDINDLIISPSTDHFNTLLEDVLSLGVTLGYDEEQINKAFE